MSALQDIRASYIDRATAARAWKAAGGKVVGYLCDTVPEEIIEAAGFMAYRISGDPDAPTESLKKYVFPYWRKHSLASRQVKQGLNNSMLDLILTGKYDFVDYLVIAYSRKNLLAFWQQIMDAKQHYPDLKVPELYILDRAITPFFDSSLFNRDRILEFKVKLEEWAGRAISDSDLAAAIAARNENKRLLEDVLALRRTEPPRVTGVEALQIIAAGQFLPIARANALIATAIEELKARAPIDGARVFVGGSPLDNTRLYELIEAAGAIVVGEDHNWGARYAEYPTDTGFPPLEAIADRYHKKPAAVQFPLSTAIAECARRAQESGAQAAIFNVYAFDDHQIWDIPGERAALEANGVPSLYLKEQPYRPDENVVADEIGRFLKTL